MLDASANPYVRAALPAVNAFARATGLTARLRERFGEYVEIVSREGGVSRRITVAPLSEAFCVAVNAEAREARGERESFGPDAPWCARSVGSVNLRDHGSDRRLEGMLNEAWDYLRSIDSAELARSYRELVKRVEDHVCPVLEGFAAERAGRVEAQYPARSFRFVIAWPGRDPQFRFSVWIDPQDGASVSYDVGPRRRRGLWRRREWVGPGFTEAQPGVLRDAEAPIEAADWTDAQALRAALAEAVTRAEALLREREAG